MDRRAVAAIATLDDEVRGALYASVRSAGAPVTRAQAAASVGISRKLAAFHLDKLVEAGLLRAGVASTGRVGRAPKVYEAAPDAVTVSVPARELGFLAAIMVEAIVDDDDDRARRAAVRVARARGRRAGEAAAARSRPARDPAEQAMKAAFAVLAGHGFEPKQHADGVQLCNCPYRPVTQAAPDLVCGINHAFVSGVVEGLGADGQLDSVLVPADAGCCVRLSRY